MIGPGELSLRPGGFAPMDGQALGCILDHSRQIEYLVGKSDTATTAVFYIVGPNELDLVDIPWARLEEVLKCILRQARRDNPETGILAGEIINGEYSRFYREVLPFDGTDDQVRGIYQHKLDGETTFHAVEDDKLIECLKAIAFYGFPSVESVLSLQAMLLSQGRTQGSRCAGWRRTERRRMCRSTVP
ncbi:uncharacterized protein BP01DRAFT_24198 [Aspergillus saccharolyticus JOP 1030-1]|uniref:Uncharacterized protein n=1 Tax=Aspergillus saccharolyticus JOP 1030-1 TaxID=1450539 RepID=A0A318ZF27_9EURO|nr:hypothetical protein BP01DRAFT_24198 [Aspergillus saccharolyticus JOP 1030-1]PYH46146.1 hypothetical protein BP01DRAFT_24198 [Aspergillus saccharolyticus JOP 1030-1]